MASEEPLFDPTLKKKKKKKAVTFTEDPLGADADPTFDGAVAAASAPAPDTGGVDLGPATVHEQMVQSANGHGGDEDNGNAMFGDLKKKKKKKDIPMDLGEDPPAPAPADPAGDDLDFSDLKKKKKKKVLLDLGDEGSGSAAPASAPPATEGEDLDFSDLKKKKKSSKKALDMAAFEQELGDSSASAPAAVAASMPKREKPPAADDGEEEEEGEDDGTFLAEDDADLGDDPFAAHRDVVVPAGIDTGGEPWLGTDRDYTYIELLGRFYSALHAQNPALLNAGGKRYTIAPPSIHRDGNKKSIFANIADICKRMHRQPEHVIQFLFAEMGTTGSVDGAGRLVIKGRFQQKQVENVLRRYIVEYVTCKTCKSPDTLLTKENRIYFMSCESCGSRRSVSAIKSGFQAQVGKRSKNKTG